VSARFLLAAAVALAACGGGGDNPGDNPGGEPVATVSGAERDDYWIDRSPYAIGIRAGSCEPGVVTAEYLIGSDGRVHAVKIVGSRPSDAKNELAVKDDLWDRRFDAGPANSRGRPIRVRQEFVLDCGPGRPKWR
jgi:hypothetical protein